VVVTTPTTGARRSWGPLGVPSSAAAHWPGIEKAPAAFREAGLLESLHAGGLTVVDHGDLRVVRWRAHRPDQRPNNAEQVAYVLLETQTAVGEVIDAGNRPLVLGGECTVTIAVIGAFVSRGIDVGLVYVDGGQDLMIPDDHRGEPILDGMGVAHLLDLPGVVDEIAGIGPRRPLLDASRLVFLGFSDEEEDIRGLVPSARFTESDVSTNPRKAALAAVDTLTRSTENYVVHVDIDVLDFLETPAADVPCYGRGLRLADLEILLRHLVADPRCAAVVVVEHNPDHGEPGGATTRDLVRTLTSALVPAGGENDPVGERSHPAPPR